MLCPKGKELERANDKNLFPCNFFMNEHLFHIMYNIITSCLSYCI